MCVLISPSPFLLAMLLEIPLSSGSRSTVKRWIYSARHSSNSYFPSWSTTAGRRWTRKKKVLRCGLTLLSRTRMLLRWLVPWFLLLLDYTQCSGFANKCSQWTVFAFFFFETVWKLSLYWRGNRNILVVIPEGELCRPQQWAHRHLKCMKWNQPGAVCIQCPKINTHGCGKVKGYSD